MNKHLYPLLLFLFALLSCEPDDICLAETPGTPEIIITFFDETNPEMKKVATDLVVKGVGKENVAHNGTADSIAIAIKTTALSTSFVFTKTISNASYSDTITLNYNSQDTFISRACGFKLSYSNLTIKHPTPLNWIKRIEIIKDTISDSKESHVKILH